MGRARSIKISPSQLPKIRPASLHACNSLISVPQYSQRATPQLVAAEYVASCGSEAGRYLRQDPVSSRRKNRKSSVIAEIRIEMSRGSEVDECLLALGYSACANMELRRRLRSTRTRIISALWEGGLGPAR